MLCHVQIPRRQRYMVCGILSVGTFAASASIVKCFFVVNYGKTGDFLCKFHHPSLIPHSLTLHPSGDSCDICIWTMIEIDIGILSASMPALKPLFKKIINSTLYSSAGSRTRGLSQSCGHQLSSVNKSGALRSDTQHSISNDIRGGSAHTRHYGQKMRQPDTESEEEIFGISKMADVRVDVETISTSGVERGANGHAEC